MCLVLCFRQGHAPPNMRSQRVSIAEHHEIDEFIAQLEQTDMGSPAWLKIMKSLQHKVLHHLAEEEREFFQQAGKNLSATEKTELAVKYQAEMSH